MHKSLLFLRMYNLYRDFDDRLETKRHPENRKRYWKKALVEQALLAQKFSRVINQQHATESAAYFSYSHIKNRLMYLCTTDSLL